MSSPPDLSVTVAGALRLANPVIAASGTWGYGDEYGDIVDVQKLGAIICKGTTLTPRDGNPQPRIVEVTCGMLNSVGLQNIGVEALIAEKAPLWATWKVPVLVNIAGNTIEEYAQIAAKLDGIAGVSGIEVNISCPNVSKGGMHFGTDPSAVYEITSAVKGATSLPVIVKLSPNVTDIVAIAEAVEKAGADAISLINTISGMAIDVKRCKPVLGNISGGLSGPAIKPVALLMVYRVAGCVKIPVIGCGGIMHAADALEFIMAGATAVQVGTASLADPRATLAVIDGLAEYLATRGIRSIAELRGVARR
jgi:dihydroorotate dehydrogenase (NAD+) catalytic subunit